MSDLIRTAYLSGALSPRDLIAFHRETFGSSRMGGEDAGGGQGGEADPQRPDGVSEDEWSALGDPGKRAIVRERERATRAEQEAAALRASRPKPTPPKPAPASQQEPQQHGEPDIAAIVQQAVAAAIAPFQQRDEERRAEDSARAIAKAVSDAAATRLHDPSDALGNLDLTGLTDGAGSPDAAKITAALDDLVKRKPHLAKVTDGRVRPAPGSMIGGAPSPVASEDERVKAALAKMQASAGIKLAGGLT